MHTADLHPIYTQPGFPDEDGNGCPNGYTPNPDFVKGLNQPCLEVVSTPPNLPDDLAETGAFDLVGALIGAIVLAYAGLALLRPRRV